MSYILTLDSAHFSDPVMRGEDIFGNRFVVFKLKGKKPEDSQPMMFICERVGLSEEPFWDRILLVFKEPEKKGIRLTFDEFCEIVVQKNHSDYALAE